MLGTCVIPFFRRIVNDKSSYSIILVIQGHLLDGSCSFFVMNSNPINASLKSSGIFVNSRSKVNFKVSYDFSSNAAWGASVSYFYRT